MRLNKFIATYSRLSRRKADELIAARKVLVNRAIAHVGTDVSEKDTVIVNGHRLDTTARKVMTVLLHKPTGYVCSRDGQGSPTVFELLPPEMRELKIAGRLDKDSSGLVVLTNDGQLMQELTHPSNDKEKVYIVTISKPLADGDIARFARGVNIGDERVSKLEVLPLATQDSQLKTHAYEVRIHEGRNRQIRRSFEALGYHVTALHRTHLGPYELGVLIPKQYKIID